MALLAEELVEEWLRRKGYFTIRGIKLGMHEMDLLAVRSDEREHFLALHFLAFGHVLHLLQDMGSVAHTRNDFIADHVFAPKALGRTTLEGALR